MWPESEQDRAGQSRTEQDRAVVLSALGLRAARQLAHSSYTQEQQGLGKGRGESDSLLRLLPMKTSELDRKKRGQIKQ